MTLGFFLTPQIFLKTHLLSHMMIEKNLNEKKLNEKNPSKMST